MYSQFTYLTCDCVFQPFYCCYIYSPNLRILDLSHNHFSTKTMFSFSKNGFALLEVLNLSWNQIGVRPATIVVIYT